MRSTFSGSPWPPRRLEDQRDKNKGSQVLDMMTDSHALGK